MLAIFIGFCWQNLPDNYQAIVASDDRDTILLVLAFIVGVAVFFGTLVWLAGKRWEESHPISPQEDANP